LSLYYCTNDQSNLRNVIAKNRKKQIPNPKLQIISNDRIFKSQTKDVMVIIGIAMLIDWQIWPRFNLLGL
jgi:hypothetical protein